LLAWLRAYGDGNLPIALYPEPDNPHDRNAVAVIAAGWTVGHLSPDYAAIWQPVVLTEHASGRVVNPHRPVHRDEPGDQP
jgi:hypothetical protein